MKKKLFFFNVPFLHKPLLFKMFLMLVLPAMLLSGCKKIT